MYDKMVDMLVLGPFLSQFCAFDLLGRQNKLQQQFLCC